MEGRDSINCPYLLYSSSHRIFLSLCYCFRLQMNSCAIFLEMQFPNPLTFLCVLLLPKERGLHPLSLLRAYPKASFGDPRTLND